MSQKSEQKQDMKSFQLLGAEIVVLQHFCPVLLLPNKEKGLFIIKELRIHLFG